MDNLKRGEAQLSQDSIAAIISGIQLGLSGIQYVEAVGTAVVAGLKEVQRVRGAARAGIQPLSIEQLLIDLDKADKILSENLRACEVQRFEFGRLWLKPANSFVRSSLLVLKGKLEGFLSRVYGADFKVRISAGGDKWAA